MQKLGYNYIRTTKMPARTSDGPILRRRLCSYILHEQEQTPNFGVCGNSLEVSVFSMGRKGLSGLDLSLGVPKWSNFPLIS